MKIKSWQFALFGLLVLVVAGGLTAYIGIKSPDVATEATSPQQPTDVKKKGPGSRPNQAVLDRASSVSTEDEEFAPEKIARTLAEVRRIRLNPTPENVQTLISLLEKSKSDVVLSETIDALGAIGMQGTYGDLAFKVLSERAMDQNFPRRAHALLTSAILGKDQVLPMVSSLLEEQGTDLLGDTGKQDVIARALNLVNSPSCIPILTKIIAGTSDSGTRRNSYEALARIGSPEAFSYLQQQAQSTTGADQAASVLALSRSDNPEFRKWIAGAIQDGTLGKDTVKALSVSTAAPDIFGNVLLKEGIDPAQKLDMLKELGTFGSRGPEREKLATAIAPLVYSDGDLQKEAIKVVGQLGGKEVSDILFPLLYSDDPSVRRETFFSYLGFATPNNYQYLFDFINDPDQKTRRMAMSMIERFYGDSDRSALEQASQSQDPFISQQAQRYLTRFK